MLYILPMGRVMVYCEKAISDDAIFCGQIMLYFDAELCLTAQKSRNPRRRKASRVFLLRAA